MKKAFPIGSLDKTKRFIKTLTGWVSVKKLQKDNIVDLPGHPDLSICGVTPKEMIKLADAPDVLTPKVTTAPGKFTTIYAAQVALLKKEITHAEFLREQAALYTAGILSKKHSTIKLK